MSSNIGGNMLLVKSSWNEDQTFRMIPLSMDCPYVECIWDPGTKVFVVISRITKTTLHMLPKLDDNCDPAPLKTKRPNGRMVKEERRTIETFQEFYLEDAEAVKGLVTTFGVNCKEFDYESFMKK